MCECINENHENVDLKKRARELALKTYPYHQNLLKDVEWTPLCSIFDGKMMLRMSFQAMYDQEFTKISYEKAKEAYKNYKEKVEG